MYHRNQCNSDIHAYLEQQIMSGVAAWVKLFYGWQVPLRLAAESLLRSVRMSFAKSHTAHFSSSSAGTCHEAHAYACNAKKIQFGHFLEMPCFRKSRETTRLFRTEKNKVPLNHSACWGIKSTEVKVFPCLPFEIGETRLIGQNHVCKCERQSGSETKRGEYTMEIFPAGCIFQYFNIRISLNICILFMF